MKPEDRYFPMKINKKGEKTMAKLIINEEEGNHEELLAKKGIYYRLWNGLVSGQTL